MSLVRYKSKNHPQFLAPGATEIKPNERPPYGCCLLIWEPDRKVYTA